MSVIVRRPVKLECTASGQPQPDITWLKDGTSISAENFRNMRITDAGATLQIIAAEASDTGAYTCSAENVAGRVHKQFSIQVQCKNVSL
jgi:hypothetical protein